MHGYDTFGRPAGNGRPFRHGVPGLTLLVWILIGAAVGAGAVLALPVEGRWARLLNLAAGIAGAVGGGLAEGHGGIGADPWEANALIVSAAGALILVGIANLFRRRPPP